MEIDHIVAHPDYNDEIHLNDIAIVHLKHDVKFTGKLKKKINFFLKMINFFIGFSLDRIRPVCLPVYEPIKTRNFDDENPFLIDWGITSHGEKHSDVMLQGQIRIIDKTTCKKIFKKHGLTRAPEQYSDRVICAGIESEAKCKYDAGSPLMMPVHDNRKFPVFQIGVTTYGRGCIKKFTPGIYASVQYFADWIVQEVGK